MTTAGASSTPAQEQGATFAGGLAGADTAEVQDTDSQRLSTVAPVATILPPEAHADATILQDETSVHPIPMTSQHPIDITASAPAATSATSEMSADNEEAGGMVEKDTAVPQALPPKQVFSLFLTPEERRKKLEADAAASASASASAGMAAPKRGRKPKSKGLVNSVSTTSSLPTATPKPPVDPKSIIDPNISKTGETHKFFQEVKASQQLASGASIGVEGGSLDGSGVDGKRSRRRYNSKPQDSPFPLEHQQFHGAETIDAINGVVARLCGVDTSSSCARADSLRSRALSSNNTYHDCYGWDALRSSPDLGITAPEYRLKPRGRDCWTHWGADRDQKWREWSEKSYRLQRPSDKEKQLICSNIHDTSGESEEFESCQRLAENEQLWQQTWVTTLLQSTGLTPGTADVPIDLKIGELWTEKYRPMRGADVLDNRANTEYLTQWLKGLEVAGWTLNPEENSTGANMSANSNAGSTRKPLDIMGTARRRRKRPRRRGAADLDDFLVYDDADDFEDPYGYLSEEDDGFFAAPKSLSSFGRLAHNGDSDLATDIVHTSGGSKTLPKSFDIKSNTILLSGPTGSCKTAAVYACAEECGYEVFEVSPGMRRTGKEVLGLVGEMAENHHVHVVPGKTDTKDEILNLMSGRSQNSPALAPAPAPAPKSTLHSFFQQSVKNQQCQVKDEDAGVDVDVDVDVDEDVDADVDMDMERDDTSKIPAATLRFQEHLEFCRPGLRELHQYLSRLCKIEGFICSSEYILSLIKYCRYDVRRCLMQLQYDSGLSRTKPMLSGSPVVSSSHSGSRDASPGPTSIPSSPVVPGSNSNTKAPQVPGSSVRRKPQRLLRISAKGIVPASAPTAMTDRAPATSPLQELEQLDMQLQYAETMSLCDSKLRMRSERAIQCYEMDQFEASKDDVVGQHLPIFKRPSGADHLLLDQELASLVEDGCESQLVHLATQQNISHANIFEDAVKEDDPGRSVAENFVPLNESMSRNLEKMQPALEQTLSLHGLRFNLDTTFSTYAPFLRCMILAEAINTVVPTGKRAMRSGGHLKRHLDMLSESERTLMLSTSFPALLPHQLPE
ncbi:hypothetical protein EDD11_004718 [Mortierella claussenii]|nr:hypothetical protein EDD11_004718 [Mortierella claussenii]